MKIGGSVPRNSARGVLWAAILLTGPAGAGGCARSVNDYLAEARSGAPTAVKDAVIAIGRILYRRESAGIPYDRADEEAILYLKDVATSNSVSMNRAAAMASLGPLRRAEAREVFLAGLRDSFWVVRFEAVRAMGREAEERYAEPLRDLLAAESRPEVRLEVVKALGQIKGPVALRTLLEVFLKRGEGGLDPQVLAYMAIRTMAEKSYGFDEVRSWEAYYRTKYGELPGEQPSPPPPPSEKEKGSGEKAGAPEGPAQSQEKETPKKKQDSPPPATGKGREGDGIAPAPADRSPGP